MKNNNIKIKFNHKHKKTNIFIYLLNYLIYFKSGRFLALLIIFIALSCSTLYCKYNLLAECLFFISYFLLLSPDQDAVITAKLQNPDLAAIVKHCASWGFDINPNGVNTKLIMLIGKQDGSEGFMWIHSTHPLPVNFRIMTKIEILSILNDVKPNAICNRFSLTDIVCLLQSTDSDITYAMRKFNINNWLDRKEIPLHLKNDIICLYQNIKMHRGNTNLAFLEFFHLAQYVDLHNYSTLIDQKQLWTDRYMNFSMIVAILATSFDFLFKSDKSKE